MIINNEIRWIRIVDNNKYWNKRNKSADKKEKKYFLCMKNVNKRLRPENIQSSKYSLGKNEKILLFCFFSYFFTTTVVIKIKYTFFLSNSIDKIWNWYIFGKIFSLENFENLNFWMYFRFYILFFSISFFFLFLILQKQIFQHITLGLKIGLL